MTSRSGTDDERHFAVWNGKHPRMPIGSPKVLIAHQDKLIAESLGALLRLTGLQVMQTQNLKSARSLLQNWKPQALILDTQLDSDSGYMFIRTLRPDAELTGRLLVAISNVWPADPVETLKDAGFDAHCRRPCATWRLVEVLTTFFSMPPATPIATRLIAPVIRGLPASRASDPSPGKARHALVTIP
ncbi:response regulator [Caballeronia sp.]|uniref:response regulator n=1 Tax=Caballeronia sp. TaxID=1931223 RepID=UPI003C332E3B